MTIHDGNSLVLPGFKEASADYVVMTPPLGLRFGREQIDKVNRNLTYFQNHTDHPYDSWR